MFLPTLSSWSLFSLGVPLAGHTGGREQGYEEGPGTRVVGEASPVCSHLVFPLCLLADGCGSRSCRGPGGMSSCSQLSRGLWGAVPWLPGVL